MPASTFTVLTWQVRAVCRFLCWLATPVGHTMVALATAFRVCGRASEPYAPLTIPAQLALLLAWAPIRLLFLTLEAAAKRAHLADTQLRRRWAAVD